jgi:hypothetical protein
MPIQPPLGNDSSVVHEKLKLSHFPLGSVDFAFFPFAGFLVMLMLLDVGHQARFFALFGKPFESLFKRLSVTHFNSRH